MSRAIQSRRPSENLTMNIKNTRQPLVLTLVAMLLLAGCGRQVSGTEDGQMNFQRIPVQFIAALGAPDQTSGGGAQNWGLWRVDPGPRGVRLNRFERLQEAGGLAPAGWRFDPADRWLE